jgi:hypothetical protein
MVTGDARDLMKLFEPSQDPNLPRVLVHNGENIGINPVNPYLGKLTATTSAVHRKMSPEILSRVQNDVNPQVIPAKDIEEDPDVNFLTYIAAKARLEDLQTSEHWEALDKDMSLQQGTSLKLPTHLLGRVIAGAEFENETTEIWAGKVRRVFSTSANADQPFARVHAEIVQPDGTIRTVRLGDTHEIILKEDPLPDGEKKNTPHYEPSALMRDTPVVIPMTDQMRQFKLTLEESIGHKRVIITNRSALPAVVESVKEENGEWWAYFHVGTISRKVRLADVKRID